mgnify:CR=1 FL=1
MRPGHITIRVGASRFYPTIVYYSASHRLKLLCPNQLVDGNIRVMNRRYKRSLKLTQRLRPAA